MNDVLPPVFSINKTYDEEIAHKGDRSIETNSQLRSSADECG